jgi:hypothetical protein
VGRQQAHHRGGGGGRGGAKQLTSSWQGAKEKENRARVLLSPSRTQAQPGVVVHPCNFSYSADGGRRMKSSRPAWAKLEILSQKRNTNKQKKAGGIAQVTEHLPSDASVQKKKVGGHNSD